MEGWRTSCPRLSIWEDALADGLVVVTSEQGLSGGRVRITAAGREVINRALRTASRPHEIAQPEPAMTSICQPIE
jgi:hypothetical protein